MTDTLINSGGTFYNLSRNSAVLALAGLAVDFGLFLLSQYLWFDLAKGSLPNPLKFLRWRLSLNASAAPLASKGLFFCLKLSRHLSALLA